MEECAALLGLGRLGSAIARRLLESGLRLIIWNRTVSKAIEFSRKYGGIVAPSPAEAVSECSDVHVVVADDDSNYSVLLGPQGVIEGLRKSGGRATIYNHVTVSIAHSATISKLLSSIGVTYVEAPVIGGPDRAVRGELLVLCAAEDESHCAGQRLRLLGKVIYLGKPPLAAAAKLAFNITFLGIVASLGEGLALAEAYGIEHERFLEAILGNTWIKTIVERYGRRLWPGGEARFTSSLALKDSHYALRALQERGVPGLIAAAVSGYYSLMVRENMGEEDYPSLAGFLAKLAERIRLQDSARGG
ncbi:MAG: hypothetical protein DSY37_04110 [Hyperthermus sp.]|nr:MAG: hypothetical protein DSY37_04110 [Hyperthermus sp.]